MSPNRPLTHQNQSQWDVFTIIGSSLAKPTWAPLSDMLVFHCWSFLFPFVELVGYSVVAYPSQGTRWKDWRRHCGPDGSCAANPGVCRCHTAPRPPPPRDRPSCSSGHTSSQAFLPCSCSHSSVTTCETKILWVTWSWIVLRTRSE